MGLPCLKPLPLCKLRDPQALDLWCVLDGPSRPFGRFIASNSRPSTASGGQWLTARPRRSLSVGTFTKAMPETTAWYQSLIPGSKLEIFEDASHLTMVEPDKYA